MNLSQIGINAISTKHASIEEALDAYAAAGFAMVEWPLSQVKARGGNVVRRLQDERGIRCIGGFEITLDAFADAETRAANLQQILENARLLETLGDKGTTMVVGTDGPESPMEDPLGVVAAAMAEACAAVEPHGVTLAIEFNWSPLVKSLRTAAEIARRSGAPNAGVLFDPAHYHCTPTKFEQINAETVPYIRHVHLDDMRDKAGELSDCNSDRVLPGAGCLDLPALIGALEKHGYAGLYCIEMFSDELWALPASEAARQMYQSLLPLTA